ncbi:BQ5605_C012g06801 [Microbotryum silenes-dioicae]|uniref:BQ5605_C012g06801 protein n=1 Tax=Microbotryum silenes-dioicae TaxID=796604 RepID=A0A2X0NWB6_9BASI|nr:BQ5605_C012g06801 [Microbotryum silenes-dioicae]
MSDLQAYLAAKYMTGAKADAILECSGSSSEKRKKKKRKVEAESTASSRGQTSTSYGQTQGRGGGLIVDDDDGMEWARKKNDDDQEDGRPVVEQQKAQFKAKASTASSWSTIREAAFDEPAYVRTPSPEPVDEEPVVVGSVVQDAAPPPPPPSKGGLQSAASLRAEQARRDVELAAQKKQADAELEARKRELRERGETLDEDVQGDDDHTATVYRDSSGRKIDLKLAKAEKAKQKREELEKEIKKMEWGKGLVQRGEKEQRQKEREKMANLPMARYADDEDMNEEMKDRERWNDPAANFLTKKKKDRSTGPKYPKYTGPIPAPNRFGIPPGYRWDGVDRSNGFEASYMQKINSRKIRSAEAHAYSTEDM